MQYINRYHVLPQKEVEFKAWLLENEPLLKEHAVEGWTYLGTWFTVMGFGYYACESRWEVDDYGALGAGWGDETNQRLMREWFEFMDQSRGSEVYLMKSASDVIVFE
jgi:hypothetical protein